MEDQPGIHKPFDRAAKEFAEEAPLLFLRLLGVVPKGAKVELTRLREETAPPIQLPDYVAMLSIDGRPEHVFHVEFFAAYRPDIPPSMARYGASLAWQYQKRVQSVLLLLRPDSVPVDIPPVGEYSVGATVVRHPFRVVKIWELDPGPVLESEDLGLAPWALLMRLSRGEAIRLTAGIRKSRNEAWIARFLSLGTLRYHRDELVEMLGGPGMGFVEAFEEAQRLTQESRLKELCEEAAGKAAKKAARKAGREGRQLGQQLGQTGEARRMLKLVLADRFPGLETLPGLDRIDNVEALETILLQHVLGASADRPSIESAIQAAASKSRP